MSLPIFILQREPQLSGADYDDKFGGGCTPGRLFDPEREDGLNLRTLELPWRGNATSVSCIPPMHYDVKPRAPSGKFNYPHFILENVPDRTYILVHAGNYPRDTYGCILVGMEAAEPPQPAIWRSRDALAELRTWAPDGFRLMVKAAGGEATPK